MAKLPSKPTGMGKRPALLIVDAINAFTNPECPLGTAVDAEIAAIGKLQAKFRQLGLPVYYTSQYYTDPSQASVWREKLPATEWLQAGSEWVEVDRRIAPLEGETIIVKHGPSGFFETDLKQRLLGDGVDATVVVGFTTSGCVRASAVDSVSGNFRTVVVPEACGDRDPKAHEANLYDLDAKYADLVSLETALDMLDALPTA